MTSMEENCVPGTSPLSSSQCSCLCLDSRQRALHPVGRCFQVSLVVPWALRPVLAKGCSRPRLANILVAFKNEFFQNSEENREDPSGVLSLSFPALNHSALAPNVPATCRFIRGLSLPRVGTISCFQRTPVRAFRSPKGLSKKICQHHWTFSEYNSLKYVLSY